LDKKAFFRLSLLEAFFTSFVVGLAETYFPAFSLSKGASSIEAGVLVSAPLIIALLMKWVLLKKFKSVTVSVWVPALAVIQLLALVFLAFSSHFAIPGIFIVLLLVYSVYWLGHFASLPAWNRWVFDLISMEQSQRYFSLRTRIVQMGIVTGLILGGYGLHLNILHWPIADLFFAMFLISALLKFFSYKLFSQHPQVSTPIRLDIVHARHLLLKYKPFLSSFSFFNLSVFLSASYVVSFLLVERHLTYEQFMWVMAGLFFGKIAMTIIIPRIESNISPYKLLYYGGLFAAPLPILWPFCNEVWMLFVVHVFSGLAWGAWEVGLSLCFFKNLPSHEKMEMISIYNMVGISTQVVGTLVGAFLLKYIIGENYEILFVMSGVIRLLCVLQLRKKTFGVL